MWLLFIIIAAFFAALTAMFAKIGIKNIDSDLATAIRTTIILGLVWGIVFLKGNISNLFQQATPKNLLFISLSALATGISWLFYFRALQIGEAQKVAAIDKISIVFVLILSVLFLNEQPNMKTIVGSILIVIGSIVIALA